MTQGQTNFYDVLREMVNDDILDIKLILAPPRTASTLIYLSNPEIIRNRDFVRMNHRYMTTIDFIRRINDNS